MTDKDLRDSRKTVRHHNVDGQFNKLFKKNTQLKHIID
jgi:hypothetical protein